MEHREALEVHSGGSAQEETRRNAPCEEEVWYFPFVAMLITLS
jgi:hypothetical protein